MTLLDEMAIVAILGKLLQPHRSTVPAGREVVSTQLEPKRRVSTLYWFLSGCGAFAIMYLAAWMVTESNANVLVLLIAVPMGGIATLVWFLCGFLIFGNLVFSTVRFPSFHK